MAAIKMPIVHVKWRAFYMHAQKKKKWGFCIHFLTAYAMKWLKNEQRSQDFDKRLEGG